MKLKYFIPAILWFIISTILLCFPGNQFPSVPFFNFPHLDKIVHLVIFFLLTFLFSYPVSKTELPQKRRKSWFLFIAIYISGYGILIEFIQKYFIPFRSFDLFDIVFDILGSFAGLYLANRIFSAKKLAPIEIGAATKTNCL